VATTNKQNSVQIPLPQPGASRKTSALGIVDPDLDYTLERLAAVLGITPRTLREQYINSGKLMAMPMGKSYVVPGYCWRHCVMASLELCDET
jgi:hypothetical protein